jgi:predicted nucleic acid-binding Zn ribbon protein
MAKLFECPDCGNAISKDAFVCPHCGRPIRPNAVQTLAGIILIFGAIPIVGYVAWLAWAFLRPQG